MITSNFKRNFSFHYGDEVITFKRTDRESDIQRVLIQVNPDCRVLVQAPSNADDSDVLQAVKKRGRWIYTQLRDFRAQQEHVTARKYVSGESHYYLGKQYLLKVIEAPSERPQVKLTRGKIEVNLHHKSPQRVKEMLNAWYKERAREIFEKRLDAVLEQALWVEKKPAFRILTMKTQWGSCSPKGHLTHL